VVDATTGAAVDGGGIVVGCSTSGGNSIVAAGRVAASTAVPVAVEHVEAMSGATNDKASGRVNDRRGVSQPIDRVTATLRTMTSKVVRRAAQLADTRVTRGAVSCTARATRTRS